MLRIRIAFCASLLVAGSAHAAIDNAGTTAGNFLSVGTGAAILSMGGATLGSGQDLNAAAWNPAALGRLPGSQFALSHASLASESSQEWLAAGGRIGGARTRWATTALYQGDGSFDGRDALGASTGSFNVSSMALGLQVAQPLGEALTAGLGAHWLNDNLGDARGHGLAFDAGVQASAGPFGFGAAVRNVGGSMQYAAGRYDLPAVYGVGASWSHAPSGLRLAVDANFPHAYYDDVRFGGEWRWQDRVALRAGYRMELGAAAGEPLGGASFGMGAGVEGMWMDYAFLASGSQAQGQHRLGLTFRPGFLNRALQPTAEANGGSNAPAVATAVAPPAKSTPAPVRPAPAPETFAPAPATAAPAPVTVALASQVPADADRSDLLPRESGSPARTVRASRPVRVSPLVMPSRAELAQVALALAPAKPAPAPKLAPAPKPAPARPALAAKPAPASPPVVAAAPPVAAVPDAPAPAPQPAPVAQVASSAPRVVVVTRPATTAKPVFAPPVQRPATVTVGAGETMADIARKWGTSVAAIMMQNDLVRDQVKPGQKLKLPRD